MIWTSPLCFVTTLVRIAQPNRYGLISVACAFLLVGCFASSPRSSAGGPRIDGSSEASFDISFGKVVRPLSAGDRRQLALALFGVLLADNCLSTNAAIDLTFLPVAIDRPADLHTCRARLNGMSYRDILDAAKYKEGNSHANAA